MIANYLYRTWEKSIFYSLILPISCCVLPLHSPARAADVPATATLPGAASSAPSSAAMTAFSSATDGQPPKPWRAVGLPKGKAPLTRMDVAVLDGERVLRLATDKSYGTLSHALPALALGAQATLRWKWRVDQGLPGADMRRKEGDD